MLTRTMLHPAKRVSLELEARAGEHKVATNNLESAKQLQLLHRAPGKAGHSQGPLPVGSIPEVPHVAQTAQTSANATPSLSPPQVAPKPTKPRAGQRGPGRDPVGETSAPSVRKAPGCACTEVIEVRLSQSVSGDLNLYQYRRFENAVFSSWNPYMKLAFLFIFFVSHVILMGWNSHVGK